jgi:REP element-mobilizing transposase RayT
LEFGGALYHVTARGDRQEAIFLDDVDRRRFLDLLGKEVNQQRWVCFAYCLMDNHYHLLIETPEPNLVRGMRRLNGVYTQAFNWRRKKPGHVFQGRYKSILVDKENYLMELCRYIVLNPVRAQIVMAPEEWQWSSYGATVGRDKAPKWLAVEKVLSLFSGRRSNYRRFVMEGVGRGSIWDELRGQIYLGDEVFLERMQELAHGKAGRGIAKAQARPKTPSADEIINAVGREYRISAAKVLERSEVEAYELAVYLMRRVGNLSLQEVGGRFGVSIARISQIQSKIEAGKISKKVQGVLRRYEL